MKRWYVVYTKAARERLAEINLLAQGFETYLPVYPSRRKSQNGATPAPTPMFSRYVFVRLDLDTGPWRVVNNTIGVSHLIAFGDRPAFVPDSVVAKIKASEDGNGVVMPEGLKADDGCSSASQRFIPGEPVVLRKGAFDALNALFFEATSGMERATVLISLLGRDVAVDVPNGHLRRAS